MDGEWHTTPPQAVGSVRIDSRECGPGSLFVALPGSETDGHEFVSGAAKRGAVAAFVTERQSASIPQFVVDDTEKTLQELSRRYRRQVIDAYVIGITGTCGKTTLKTILADLLETNYRVGRTPGNFNNHLGVPLTLLNEGDGEVLVAEVATNAPGEIGELSRWLRPDMGIITHVGPAHLAGLETVEQVAEEKGDLLAELATDGIGLLPDWIRHREILADKSAVLPRSVHSGRNGDYRLAWVDHGENAELTVNDSSIGLNFGGTGLVRDAVLAASAGILLGVDEEDIKASLEDFEPLPGRGGVLEQNDTELIDGTYNANPDSMRTALDRLAERPGPRLAILGDMKELGDQAPTKHRELAEYASDLDDVKLMFVGTHESSFRDGVSQSVDSYVGVESVQELPAIDWFDYGSVLVKASRAIGLDQLLEDGFDQP